MAPRSPASNRRRSSRLRAAALVLAAAILPLAAIGLAQANDFRSNVRGFKQLLPQAYASESASNLHLWALREFDPLVPAEYNALYADPERDVAVAIYASTSPSYGNPEVIRLAGGRATPGTLVVPFGVKVAFRNDDPFTHVLVSPNDPHPIELEPGAMHQFTTPSSEGLLTYSDVLIKSVRAWIVIDARVTMQRAPAHDGTLKIPLDQGEYTFTTFFEGKPRDTLAEFKIPATGSATGRDFQLVPNAAAGSSSGK